MACKEVRKENYFISIMSAVCCSSHCSLFYRLGEHTDDSGMCCIQGAGRIWTAMLYVNGSGLCGYAEAKTGIRADGTASAVQSFSAKLGSAIGGAAGVAMLAAVGYVANTTQTQAAMQGMNAVINLAPAVCWLLALIPVCLYPLNEKKMSTVKEKLARVYQMA